MLDRLKSLPDRWPWLRTIVDVQMRFGELHGGYLAAAVTLAAFLSLFPLLLVSIAVIGFFASGAEDLPREVISQLGIPAGGDAARAVESAIETAEQSRRTASIVGLAGLLWSGLGLVAALEYAYNSVWQVKGRGWTSKLFGLVWLGGAGVVFLLSVGITAVARFLPGPVWPLNLLVGVAVSVALFLWTSHVLGNRDVGWRPLLPGALLAAVGFEVLKLLGSVLVPRAVASSSALYGSIGVVFAVLAWLFIFGRLLVYAATLNVVLWEREHGTVTVELTAPKLPGRDPIEATRAGETEDETADEATEAERQLALDLMPDGARQPART